MRTAILFLGAAVTASAQSGQAPIRSGVELVAVDVHVVERSGEPIPGLKPADFEVFIDGKSVGVTPLSVPDIGIGSHVVRLELPDHRIWSSATRVVSGETVRVTGSLERIQ